MILIKLTAKLLENSTVFFKVALAQPLMQNWPHYMLAIMTLKTVLKAQTTLMTLPMLQVTFSMP